LKIYIKLKNGRNLKILVPISLLKAAMSLGNFGIFVSKKYIPKEQVKYIENIDFREFRTSVDVLKNYKGLKMVEVKAKDGTGVTVVV